MPRTKFLLEFEKEQVMALREEGMTFAAIAKTASIAKRCVALSQES